LHCQFYGGALAGLLKNETLGISISDDMSEPSPNHIAVIDIGKTNVKVVLFDLKSRVELAVHKQANTVRHDGPYPHYDVEKLWAFMLNSLRDLQHRYGVDAISMTTHGATAALVDDIGELSLPILDYEHTGPDDTRSEYESLRPDFSETGSPSLPIGLNLGAQLFWQQKKFEKAFARTKTIMLYPQYWSFRLCGVRASEVTSLGTHTDLWAPQTKCYSTLLEKLGWTKLMAPMQRAQTCLGTITESVAVATGLPKTTSVYCGIHDSNASLLPHLLSRPKPFSVVSSGTWVIVMAIGGIAVTLDPARESLLNVSADGNSVPTSRFMGGREYELLMQGESSPEWTEHDLAHVLENGIYFAPVNHQASIASVEGQWKVNSGVHEGELSIAQRHIVVSFYLACMTAKCLALIGAKGDTIVEGPFASNRLYLEMLATVTGRNVHAAIGTGTSLGAALLALPQTEPLAEIPTEVFQANQTWQNHFGQDH
jgi:sugar (pentulose or hexulose) kinase